MLRRVASKGLVLAALTLGLITVLALLGPVSRLADAFSHLRLHLAAAGLVLMLAASLVRWPLALAGAVICALNLTSALGYANAALEPSRGGRPIRIFTLNTLKGVENTDRIVARIRAEAADFVVLQEVTAEKLAIVDRLAADYPWHIDCRGHWHCDVALLSRHPWVEAEAVKIGAKLALARFGPELGNLTVATIHLNWPLVSDQQAQLGLALARLKRGAAGPIVLAGDFNALPWSGVLSTFAQRSGLLPAGPYTPTWPRRGYVSGRSCLLCVPQLQIDQVMVSGELRVLATRTGDDVGSDHLPLIAELELPRDSRPAASPARQQAASKSVYPHDPILLLRNGLLRILQSLLASRPGLP